MKRGVIGVRHAAVGVELFQDRVEAVDRVVEPLDEIRVVPSELLDPRAGLPDVPLRLVGRRERMERSVVGPGNPAIEIELVEEVLEVVVEGFHAVEELALRHPDPFGEIVICRAKILGDGQERIVIRVADRRVRVELREDEVEFGDEVFDLVEEIVLVVAAIPYPPKFSKSHRPPCFF